MNFLKGLLVYEKGCQGNGVYVLSLRVIYLLIICLRGYVLASCEKNYLIIFAPNL